MKQSDGTDLDHGMNQPGCRRFLIVVVMVILTIIIICLMACKVYPEGQLVITKKYIGRAKDCCEAGKYTKIRTSEAILYVCGAVHVPDSSHCYIRVVPVYARVHPDVKMNLQRQYFSFNGTEYRVKTW
jgi:hypothetical protein